MAYVRSQYALQESQRTSELMRSHTHQRFHHHDVLIGRIKVHVTLAEFLTNISVTAQLKFSPSLTSAIKLYIAFSGKRLLKYYLKY